LESPEDPTKLWLIGGSDGDFPSRQILEFDMETASLIDTGKELNKPRARAMGCCLYDDLYVFGGGQNDCERMEGNKWVSYKGFPNINEHESLAATWFKR
jgi:hypothetical protein